VRFRSENGATARQSILKETTAAAAASDHKNKDFAKFYEITMKRIIEKGADFASGEVSRLRRVVESGSVSKSKSGEMAKRINIVSQFVL